MDFPTWLVTGGLGLIILVIGLSWSPLLTILVLILGVALFFIVKNRRENEAEEERISIMNAEQDRMNARKQYLLNKFSDPSLVQRVLDRNIELGDSKQFVLEAFGYPAAIDNDVLKTKTREILKYKKGNEARTNQYNIQIKLENDIVVGWEDKN